MRHEIRFRCDETEIGRGRSNVFGFSLDPVDSAYKRGYYAKEERRESTRGDLWYIYRILGASRPDSATKCKCAVR